MTLRMRLVLWVAGLTTALLLGLSLSVERSLRELSVRVVDEELSARAEAIAREVEVRRSGELDWDEALEVAGDHPVRLETLDGTVLFSVPPVWPPLPAGTEGAAIARGSSGEPWRVYSLRFRPEHAERSPGTGELLVRVGDRAQLLENLLPRFRAGLLVALVLGLLLGGAGAAALAQFLLKPIRRLSSEVAAVEATSLHRRVDETGAPRELRPLASAFNGVLARLEAAFERQRSFVARASHALRTPTAGILSRAEVALRRERSPEEYRAALADVVDWARESAERISSLLAMMRAENPDRAQRVEGLRLEEVSEELRRLFEPRAVEAGLTTSWDVPPELEVWADRDGLRELLEVLLDNALRYTPRGGQFGLSAREDGGGAILEVWDTGPGIPAEEQAQVFESFFRGSAALASGAKGSGLGLSIARRIASAHGATLSLEAHPGGGLVARARWPGAPG